MRTSRYFALLCAAALGFAACGIPANAQGVIDANTVAMLKPGQSLWDEAAAPAGPVSVVVSIATQRAFVYRGDVLIGVSAVSTGAPGHDTPTGTFTILQKQVMHRSNLYNDAPMPFMQRLTWDGIAIHSGRNPGYPDSHGCVRVPSAFAKKLFGLTRLGAKVTVTDEVVDAPDIGEAPMPDPAATTTEPPVIAEATGGGMLATGATLAAR